MHYLCLMLSFVSLYVLCKLTQHNILLWVGSYSNKLISKTLNNNGPELGIVLVLLMIRGRIGFRIKRKGEACWGGRQCIACTEKQQ